MCGRPHNQSLCVWCADLSPRPPLGLYSLSITSLFRHGLMCCDFFLCGSGRCGARSSGGEISLVTVLDTSLWQRSPLVNN